MIRKAHPAGLQPPLRSAETPVSPPRTHGATAAARAAGEIADVALVLRNRAVEFDLQFLAYLLEMAFSEAFEQSQKHSEESSA